MNTQANVPGDGWTTSPQTSPRIADRGGSLLKAMASEMIGENRKLQDTIRRAAIVAATDASVLITGETGTGKEMVAALIHRLSGRRDHRLVKVNCAAIPLGLLESELFGHERGAFTGATAQRIGRFELANNGTLFLDEIGDIPLELQPKLLRALQDREFERLGSTRTLQSNIRLIAATHRNLPQMLEEGKFRADLYYRINVFPISVPALRDRSDDIPRLVRHFVRTFGERMNKQIDVIPLSVMESLTNQAWPGNVRELENFIERLVILSEGRVLAAPADEFATAVPGEDEVSVRLEDVERRHIAHILRESDGVICTAALAWAFLPTDFSQGCGGWESSQPGRSQPCLRPETIGRAPEILGIAGFAD